MTSKDKNHRPIPCEGCEDAKREPTILTAWASDWLLAEKEVTALTEITSDVEVREMAAQYREDCAIEGNCYDCDGPDDGDDGNQDD